MRCKEYFLLFVLVIFFSSSLGSPPGKKFGPPILKIRPDINVKEATSGFFRANWARKPIDVLKDVYKDIKEPELDLKKIPEIVSTHSVFKKDNETLNCFGLPVESFAKPLEVMITKNTRVEDVKFLFATRKHPEYTSVTIEDFDLEKTDFNVSRPTFLISHGFLNSGQLPWLKNMKDAFLKLEDANVIVVDWHQGSNTWNYYAASHSTRIVGLQIAKLLFTIKSKAEMVKDVPDIERWRPIYFTGHSLGSHIVAHAAYLMKEIQKESEKKWIVTRITGLDPVQPCYKEVDLSLRLDKDDALFVDVIHSNTGFLSYLGLGLPDELGHIDFYPNGGKVYPECSDVDTSIYQNLALPGEVMIETICSQGRAYDFMTESMLNSATNNCTFIGYKWDRTNEHVFGEKCEDGKCAEMGVNSIYVLNHNPERTGSFFVPTRSSAPYCEPQKEEQKVFEDQPTYILR